MLKRTVSFVLVEKYENNFQLSALIWGPDYEASIFTLSNQYFEVEAVVMFG